MSSTNRRLIYNTRERILSTDQNDTQALVDSTLDLTIAAAAIGVAGSGPGFGSSLFAISGVLDGLLISANAPGVDLVVKITPGIGYKVGAAPTTLDCTLRRIELLSTVTIDLTTFVDALPRWVAIEAAPADGVELVALRDIWQPALGTFVPANVDKIRAPAPVITANAGTPAAAPSFPDGLPGVIPLGYVYLSGGAVSITTTDFVRSRPLYSNVGKADVTGGGVDVPTTGGSIFTPRSQRGVFFTGGKYSTGTASLDATNTALWNSPESFAGLAGFNNRVYAYVVAAPYPLGYDADVPRRSREFQNYSTHIPSCPNITAPLIMLSTSAPAAGAPYGGRNLVASQDPTWGSGGAVTSTEVHYLGCIGYVTSSAGFLAQAGSGPEVRILEALFDPIMQAVVSAGAGVTAFVDFFPGDVDLTVNTPPPGAGVMAPLNTLHHLVGVTATATSTLAALRIFDANSLGNVVPILQIKADNSLQRTTMVWCYSSTTIRLEVQELTAANAVTGACWYLGYRDPILEGR